MYNYYNNKSSDSIVFTNSYVNEIYHHISCNFFPVSSFFKDRPDLNFFLNEIGYPIDRNVNHDMVIYWIRDNRELVEFNLL
jgi:hypothetical protein